MSFRDVDKGYRALIQRANMSGVILVGVFAADGEKQYEHGASVLDVAIWNEFGTDTVPQRSFIRAWFDENETKCREAVRRMAEGVLAGKFTVTRAKEQLAQRFVGEIQKRIAAGVPPPNAPETIERKGSSKPLIATGQMRTAITYRVE